MEEHGEFSNPAGDPILVVTACVGKRERIGRRMPAIGHVGSSELMTIIVGFVVRVGVGLVIIGRIVVAVIHLKVLLLVV